MEFSTLLFVLGVGYAMACDYAKYTPTHTMCVYKGPGCDLISSGFKQNQIKVILDAHNKVRNSVATGTAKKQPSAANMKQLTWDAELATIAQRLVDQCVMKHDKGKNRSHKYENVGQNLFMSQSSAPLNNFDMSEAVTSWYEEIENMNENYVHAYPKTKPPKTIGHYTQLVWANTETVGCGYAHFLEDGWYTILIGCNYGPGGNYQGQKLYEVGPACSKCSSGCSSQYPGLCK